MEVGETKVIQVTNLSPIAAEWQIRGTFSLLGEIEDIKLYPSLRNINTSLSSVCYVKFKADNILPMCLHMTNTVLIDRAIIVQPFLYGDIPDELSGLGKYFISIFPRLSLIDDWLKPD